MTGIDGCRARAASGHAAAPPISVVNSRFLTRSPRRRGRTAPLEFRGRVPSPRIDGLLDRNIGWLGAARFMASASDGSCRSICSNLSFRYTQLLDRDIDDDNR